MTEFTFALIKSHAADRAHRGPELTLSASVVVEAVMLRIIREGLLIRASRWHTPSNSQIERLYREHISHAYWPTLRDSVSGLTVPMVLWGDNAIVRWRQILGATDPAKAAPNTIRANFGDHYKMVNNVAHGSDSEQAAWREIGIFFPEFVGTLRAEARVPVPKVRGDDPAQTAGDDHIQRLREHAPGRDLDTDRASASEPT